MASVYVKRETLVTGVTLNLTHKEALVVRQLNQHPVAYTDIIKSL